MTSSNGGRDPNKNSGCDACQFRDNCYEAYTDVARLCPEYLEYEVVPDE